MRLHPMHPAAWVLDQLRQTDWTVTELLSFTRASTLVLAHRSSDSPVVLKAGFGSDHVLAELDPHDRQAAYGFYWYRELAPAERNLTREDFRHEIDLMTAATGARHVVPLREHGSAERFDWYTMPYLTGGDFRRLLARDLDLHAGMSILADVATGLHGLHQRGIVHRDIYQENILICEGRGFVTDLGAARRVGTPHGPVSRGPETHWPPEYATGYATATPAADVFSLAVLIYRFLAGDLPRFSGRPPEGFLGAVVSAALSPAPKDRPTMTELRDALMTAPALR